MMTKANCINNDCPFYHQSFAGPMCSASALFRPEDCVSRTGEPVPKVVDSNEKITGMSPEMKKLVTWAMIGDMFRRK